MPILLSENSVFAVPPIFYVLYFVPIHVFCYVRQVAFYIAYCIVAIQNQNVINKLTNRTNGA